VEMVSASRIDDEIFRVDVVEEFAGWDCRFDVVA
jgi:hypothetical protein